MSDKPLTLPPRPDLDWLKNRAKEKLAELRARRPSAKLADAQLLIARDYGFSSWRALKEHVEGHTEVSTGARGAPMELAKLPANHPLAIALVEAIHGGDIIALKEMLATHAGLARIRLERPDGDSHMSLLHVASDWPGRFPRSAEVVTLLINAGADVNARFAGPHTETPLHWAASCDDVAALDALLDNGADIEAPGAVIGGGTPLADAVAFA
ncbi:MAG: hypothetical protein KDA32_13465, partial [Phycisphaerales bacterium]|nr:hypothetical protein [Phycisphaerales bacterium]